MFPYLLAEYVCAHTKQIFWMYVAVNTIFFQNMLLCIVIDAFYEASNLGKAAPMVQEDIRFCCHHYKFGLKHLSFYDECATASRKKKKDQRMKEHEETLKEMRDETIEEMGGITTSVSSSFNSNNPLKTSSPRKKTRNSRRKKTSTRREMTNIRRKSEAERIQEVLKMFQKSEAEHDVETPRKHQTTTHKGLKPRTFISQTTVDMVLTLQAKRQDRRYKKTKSDEFTKEEIIEAENIFCFPFIAIYSVFKVLLRPLKEVYEGTGMSDPHDALLAVAEHSAFKGEVLPNGEGASQAPVKYETTIAQVCYNLQMQQVHPWIIDRIAVRLENLVRGGAETPMRELRVTPVVLRARTKYDAFNSKAEFDRISEQLADLVAAQPGAAHREKLLNLDEKREGLRPYEIYKDGSARDCLSVEIDKMQRAVEIAEVVRDVIGAIGTPRQGVEHGAAWRAKIDVQTKGMTDAARCRWLEAQLIGTNYRHGSDGATVREGEIPRTLRSSGGPPPQRPTVKPQPASKQARMNAAASGVTAESTFMTRGDDGRGAAPPPAPGRVPRLPGPGAVSPPPAVVHPRGWSEHEHEGDTYYNNDYTGETTFTKPTLPAAPEGWSVHVHGDEGHHYYQHDADDGGTHWHHPHDDASSDDY